MEKLAKTILETINTNTMNNNAKIAYIQKLCEEDIFNSNREKSCTKTETKRIKSIEKFLSNVKFKPEICQYIMISKNKATYTNGHIMVTLPRELVNNIKNNYILPHMLQDSFPDCSKVIPQLPGDVATYTITYGELMTLRKLSTIAKKGLRGRERDFKDIHRFTFSDSVIRAYNIHYLIHCCEVAGVDELTLKIPAGDKNPCIPATIDTENGCKFVVCGCRIVGDNMEAA